jgi:hypothetical protein
LKSTSANSHLLVKATNRDYIPSSDIGNITTWPTSGAGIDLGKFFTPGYLAIDKLLELESGGRSPVFYGFKEDADPVPLTSEAAFTDDYSDIGFKITVTQVKDIVVGFDDLTEAFETVPLSLFDVKFGKALYKLYHK